MTNDDLQRDETVEESVSRKRRSGRPKGKSARKSVSKRKAEEVKPLKTSDEDAPSPESTETLGLGSIPSTSEEVPEIQLGESIERVNVRSLWPSRMIIKNAPSGEIYDFLEAGKTLSVRSKDVQHLLNANRSGTRGCCGSSDEKRKFELA